MNNWLVDRMEIKDWNIDEIALNYHHEFLVYKREEEKQGKGEWFRTLEDAFKYVKSKIED